MFDGRYKLIRSSTSGKDELVDRVLAEDPISAGLYQQALSIYKSKLKKGYIESALLCSRDLPKISEILDLPLPLVDFYQEVFFDVAEADRLTKIEHIEQLQSSNKSEAILKMWSLSHGLDFLAWRLGHKINISPVDGLAELFSTCIYKSKEAMFNPSNSETSKESVKWAKLSTDIARLLKVWIMDSSAAKKDLVIAIREVVPEFEGIDSLLLEE